MRHAILAWYGVMSSAVQGPGLALQGWIEVVDVPVITVLLFGVLASLSPCQLTTNLGALAYAAGTAQRHPPLALAAAYVTGKVSVYVVAGIVIMLVGLEARGAAVPVALVARRALGPLMILVGLAMLGMPALKVGVGQRLAARLAERWRTRGLAGAYLLGVAFSFALCPTLFWLFFGLTLPLALQRSGGWTFPGLFAVGASLPLLIVAAVVGAGLAVTERVAGSLARGERILRKAAGVVLILTGVHDTIVYWLL